MSDSVSGREAFLEKARAYQSRPPQRSKSGRNLKNNSENNQAYVQEMQRRQALREAEEGAVREQHMEAYRRRAEEWRMTVPERWRDASLEKIDDQGARALLNDRLERLNDRAGRNRSSIIVAGKMGRGKTYLGYAYAYETIARGLLQPHQVLTASESVLASITRAGFKQSEKWDTLTGEGKRFWLINDVGRGDFSDPVKRMEVWHEFVDYVYEIRGTLVITTNMEVRGNAESSARGSMTVDKWLGNSTVDRLKHMVHDGIVNMNGANKREEVGESLEEKYNSHKRSR